MVVVEEGRGAGGQGVEIFGAGHHLFFAYLHHQRSLNPPFLLPPQDGSTLQSTAASLWSSLVRHLQREMPLAELTLHRYMLTLE
jgi:hypothetical protein